MWIALRDALLVALLGVVCGCARCDPAGSAAESPAVQIDPVALIFPYQWKGEIDKSSFREPSGIVFHPTRKTLFVCGDEGHLMEMTTEGQVIQSKLLREGADQEGVTVDPATGLLYVVIEGEEAIIEVDPDTFEQIRRWDIDREFEGRMVMKSGGQGIEAMTFVPKPNHPEGGVFIVANQCFSKDDPEDASALLELHIPIRTSSEGGQLAIAAYHPMPIIDLAGLQYDAVTGDLFVCTDADNVIMQVSLDGEIRHAWAFPGDNQEGIAWDNDGFMYIAQDSGGILKIRWFRDPAMP